MKILFIALFLVGSMFSLAGYGEKDKRRKKIYWVVAGLTWLTLLVLANI